ncbi:MAG: SDR family NAD(P)-dependent oxidoreductase [Myxococcales bacterium]|nr:SDR family NAD(P)-dependent oxidoreductase [Myxococcales bacterium]
MGKLALVTGGNRGIGLEVVRQLLDHEWDVLFTVRSAAAARGAVEDLGRRGDPVLVDLTQEDAGRILSENVGDRKLDALVHNAAVALNGFDADVVRRTMAVNLLAPMGLTEALLPQVADGAQIVAVSSGMGELSSLPSGARRRLSDPELDPDALRALVASFADDVEAGKHMANGWPSSAYKISKAALNAWVRWLAPTVAPRGIRVHAVCPGWVRTDMGGPNAPRSVQQGASGIVWAAERTDEVTGDFCRDEQQIPW